MITKITKADYPDQWENFIDDFSEFTYNAHRRGSTFFSKALIDINEEYFPEFPELWGYWETNLFTRSDDYGIERSEIRELSRVEQKSKMVETFEWVPVQSEENE